MQKQKKISYYRERVCYTNVCSYGEITEVVVFFAPKLSYNFHIFVLQNGEQIKKLYRKSLSGAKNTVINILKDLKKNKTVKTNINGITIEIPEHITIPIIKK